MLPDVPTTAEAGLPDFRLTVWYGLSAAKGTPAPIVQKLNQALSAAMDDPGQAVRGFGLRRKEIDLWAKVLGSMKPAQPAAPR
jgi:Tripartite tricarboxylate transporter family receptor